MRTLAIAGLTALVACSGTSRAPAPSSSVSAPQIVKRMLAMYAATPSYVDRGESTAVFVGRGHTITKSFATAFVRPDRFRFEVREDGRADTAHVIWRERGRAFSRMSAQRWVDEAELGDLLASASGVTGGLSTMIPGLLLPGEVSTLAFENLAELTLAGREVIDGRPCWRIAGRGDDGASTTLWIDEQSYLVRRIAERVPIVHDGQAIDVEHTVTLAPSLAEPTAAQLEAPSIAGLQVRKVTKPPWLGTRFDANTTRIVQIVPGSPAAGSGLRVGDEVVSIDGVALTTAAQIVRTIAALEVGARVTVDVERGGSRQSFAITLAERPSADQVARDSLLDKPAPAFSIQPLAGTAPASLAALRGRVVLVDFWATWCGPCATQFPHLNRWHGQYANKGLSIVALSSEEPDVLRAFVAEQKLAYPIALDPDDAIRRSYLAPGIPTTVIVDKRGVVRYVHVGVARASDIESVIVRLLGERGQ